MYVRSSCWFCVSEDRRAVQPLPVPSNDSVPPMLSLCIYRECVLPSKQSCFLSLQVSEALVSRTYLTKAVKDCQCRAAGQQKQQIVFPPNLLCIVKYLLCKESHHFLQPIPGIPDLAQPVFSVAEGVSF